MSLPRRWRRTYVRGAVDKEASALVADANDGLIRARDATERAWRPGDRFACSTVLQLLHLAGSSVYTHHISTPPSLDTAFTRPRVQTSRRKCPTVYSTLVYTRSSKYAHILPLHIPRG